MAVLHPGNKTMGLWVCGGRRWESVGGVQITDSQWSQRFTGHKMGVSRRCCKSVRPTSSIPTPTITSTAPHRRTHPHNANQAGTSPAPLHAAPLMSASWPLAAFCSRGHRDGNQIFEMETEKSCEGRWCVSTLARPKGD